MSVAHDSLTGAHLGYRRTKDKVLSNFYWPGVDGDVTRYCRSCDMCQRTVKKGIVPRVPLEKVPLVDTPLKRVAMDIVGPINPPKLGGWGSDETVNDLQYGDQLTPDQRRQLEEIASSYSSIFSDRPGTVSTEEHRIELTSSIH
ncbi:Gypsy retrotransposon integrase-like protein 1, partial [Elysia marginata]